MKSTVLVLTISGLCWSCIAQEVVKFKTYEGGNKVRYLLYVPEGYELSKAKDPHYQEHRAKYPDNSIIYITNDEKSGGSINTAKVDEFGDAIFLRILDNDTLDIEGFKNGTHWRERKMNQIVVGYINVLPNKKKAYDKAISTLRRD